MAVLRAETRGTKTFWVCLVMIGMGAVMVGWIPNLREVGILLVAMGAQGIGIRDGMVSEGIRLRQGGIGQEPAIGGEIRERPRTFGDGGG